MKVVIAAINSQYIHSSLAPWYLKAGIKKYGDKDIETLIVEGNINQENDYLINLLTQDNADILGISCYIWNIKTVKNIISGIRKKLPNAKIVLGGPEVTFNVKETFDTIEEVDFISIGEGEKSFALLVNAIKNKEETKHLNGVAFKENGIVYQNPVSDIDHDPPNPFNSEYFKRLGGRLAYVETSRGCPFSCAFCLSGRDNNVRFFDMEKTKSDFLALAKSDARTIKLVDRTFNCNKERTYELISFIDKIDKEGKIKDGTCFHFEVAADLFDDKTMNLLAKIKPGLIQMEAGLQSFNEKTLEAVDRKTDISIVEKNLKRLLEPGNIHIHIDLIAGLPEEGLNSFKKSFNLGYSLKAHMLQLGFLKLIHGSKLREDREKYDYQFDENPPYEVFETKWLKKEEFEIIHGVEEHIDKLYNSGRFTFTLEYVFEVTKLKPFDLFLGISKYGEERKYKKGMHLEDYSEFIFNYFSNFSLIDTNILRDKVLCDMLVCNNSGKVFKFLQSKNKHFGALAKKYRRTGYRTGVAVLQKGAVWVDYSNKNPVTGRYKLNFIDIADIYK